MCFKERVIERGGGGGSRWGMYMRVKIQNVDTSSIIGFTGLKVVHQAISDKSMKAALKHPSHQTFIVFFQPSMPCRQLPASLA